MGCNFFASHGMEVNGANYLLPTDAKIAREWLPRTLLGAGGGEVSGASRLYSRRREAVAFWHCTIWRDLSCARFGLLAYVSCRMLSLALLRTAVRNSGALILRGNSSTLILFADWKWLVLGVDAFATTTFSIVDRTRHD